MRRSLTTLLIFITFFTIIFAGSSFSMFPVSFGDELNEAIKTTAISAILVINQNDRSKDEDFMELPAEPEGCLSEAELILRVPGFLPVDTTLICELSVINANPGLSCLLTWYVDDEIIFEEQIITGYEIDSFKYDFIYSPQMAESAVIRATLQFITQEGEKQKLEDEGTVKVENFTREGWLEREAPRITGLILSTYQGNGTLKWAEENDYSVDDKELFVNIQGYESETEYLIWVNRAHQRMNIFEGSAGNWELIEVFMIATGRPGMATPRGVTFIPSRTTAGWVFEDENYFVRPVVRFFPEGSRLAFHSRPYHLETRELIDERIGVPVSKGCIRMLDEDIWHIYNNIPDRTTVVIH